MRVVLIENFRAVFYAPFYAACALGAYEAEGLEVELKPAAELGKALQAVSAGAGQVSWGGPLRILIGLDRDPKCGYVAFCEVVGRDPFFLVGRTPNPGFTPAQLPRWALAAVTEVPTPWICLQHDLRCAGIDPSSVKLAPGRTMAENAAALRAGEVDLIQVFQPYAQALMDEGAGHLWYAAASRGPTAYTSLNTTRAFIEREPETVLRLTRAMYRTLKWIAARDGRALAEAIAGYFPEVPVARLAACCERYRSLGLWNRTPVLQREGLEWLRDAMLGAGAIRTRFRYEDCVDMRFAEQVLREDPPPAAPK
ncbi:MAG TPA: ABC transporter substrate-binding protein [Burkholderiales bacterium]|nr:ABC transporter substrate-binding protein [Burkholderiales bacterium]